MTTILLIVSLNFRVRLSCHLSCSRSWHWKVHPPASPFQWWTWCKIMTVTFTLSLKTVLVAWHLLWREDWKETSFFISFYLKSHTSHHHYLEVVLRWLRRIPEVSFFNPCSRTWMNKRMIMYLVLTTQRKSLMGRYHKKDSNDPSRVKNGSGFVSVQGQESWPWIF